MAPPVSTTSMLGMLNKSKVADFVKTVNDHMDKNPTDQVSALKVVRTVASFAFNINNLNSSTRLRRMLRNASLSGEVIACLVKCVSVAVPSGKRDVVKDMYSKLYHVMERLVKQEQLHEVVSLCPTFLQLSGALVEPAAVGVRGDNLSYG